MNSNNSITLPKDFDVTKISYNDVRMLDNGGKVVYVSYNKAPLVFQTPEMTVPFGMKDWEGNKKFVMDLSFKGKDSRASVQSFYDVLESLDNKLVEDGFGNQATWFKGKKLPSKEVVEALYTPLIKHAKDKTTGEFTDKFPATFKVNVPYKENRFTCEVYDDKRNIIDLDTVETKGSKVTAIIQFMGLWIAGGKFGSSWRVMQMKITPSATLRGYAFRDVPEEKIEDIEETHDAKDIMDNAVKSDDETAAEAEGEDDVVVTDSDDDELEVQVKKPAAAKKVVMKKK
jgi:hypothetical protein